MVKDLGFPGAYPDLVVRYHDSTTKQSLSLCEIRGDKVDSRIVSRGETGGGGTRWLLTHYRCDDGSALQVTRLRSSSTSPQNLWQTWPRSSLIAAINSPASLVQTSTFARKIQNKSVNDHSVSSGVPVLGIDFTSLQQGFLDH